MTVIYGNYKALFKKVKVFQIWQNLINLLDVSEDYLDTVYSHFFDIESFSV